MRASAIKLGELARMAGSYSLLFDYFATSLERSAVGARLTGDRSLR